MCRKHLAVVQWEQNEMLIGNSTDQYHHMDIGADPVAVVISPILNKHNENYHRFY